MNLEDRGRHDAERLRTELAGVPIVSFERVRRADRRRRNLLVGVVAAVAVAVIVALGASLPADNTEVAEPSLLPPDTTITSTTTQDSAPAIDSTTTSIETRSGRPNVGCPAIGLSGAQRWTNDASGATDKVVAFVHNPSAVACETPGVVSLSIPGIETADAQPTEIGGGRTVGIRWDVCSDEVDLEHLTGTVSLGDESFEVGLDYAPANCPMVGVPVIWDVPEVSSDAGLDVVRLEYRTVDEAPTFEFNGEHPDLGLTFSGAVDLDQRAFQIDWSDATGATTGSLVYDGIRYERVDGVWIETGEMDFPTTASWLDEALLGDWTAFATAVQYGVVTDVEESGHVYRLELDTDTFERATTGPDDSVHRDVTIVVTLDDELGLGTIDIITTTPTGSSTSSITIWNRFGPEAIDEP